MIVPILALGLASAAGGVSALPVTVQAAPGAAYAVKCHVRTYRTKEGVLANTFTIMNKGPYRDVIPSANAQCQIWKTGGAGPVALHIAKDGDHVATASEVGKPAALQVW